MIRTNVEPIDFDGKLVIDKSTVGTVTTTYICRAFYSLDTAPLKSDPVWYIEQYVKDTATGIEERFRPIWLTSLQVSQNYEFIFDDRASLTYV